MNHTETIQTAYNELKSEEEMLRKNLADLLKKIKPLEKYLKEVGVIQNEQSGNSYEINFDLLESAYEKVYNRMSEAGKEVHTFEDIEEYA